MHKPENISSLLKSREYVANNDNSPNPMKQFTSNEMAKPIRLHDLLEMDLPNAKWVIDGLVPSGITILSARPGSYKTWLMLEFAKSVSAGELFIGQLAATKSAVLMIDEESSLHLLQERIDMLDINPASEIHFMVGSEFKAEDKNINQVLKYCIEKNIKFITIDSLTRIHTAKENDSVQMSLVFEKLRRFTRRGISILIAHHDRKSSSSDVSGDDIRGSSDILAAIDCHLGIKRKGNDKRIILAQSKLRSAEELPGMELTVNVDDEKFAFQFEGKLNTRSMLIDQRKNEIQAFLENRQLNIKQIGEEFEKKGINFKGRKLTDVLKSLVNDNVLLPPRSGIKKELLYGPVKVQKVDI